MVIWGIVSHSSCNRTSLRSDPNPIADALSKILRDTSLYDVEVRESDTGNDRLLYISDKGLREYPGEWYLLENLNGEWITPGMRWYDDPPNKPLKCLQKIRFLFCEGTFFLQESILGDYMWIESSDTIFDLAIVGQEYRLELTPYDSPAGLPRNVVIELMDERMEIANWRRHGHEAYYVSSRYAEKYPMVERVVYEDFFGN